MDAQSTHKRVERLPSVMARIGMGRSWIYREVAAGRFPQPIKIGRSTVWDSAEIDRWLEALIESAPQRPVLDRGRT